VKRKMLTTILLVGGGLRFPGAGGHLQQRLAGVLGPGVPLSEVPHGPIHPPHTMVIFPGDSGPQGRGLGPDVLARRGGAGGAGVGQGAVDPAGGVEQVAEDCHRNSHADPGLARSC